MKIIDLLNKIANGEEVPEKIKIKDEDLVYTYQEDEYGAYDYYCVKIEKYLMDIHNILRIVNAEIEVIEGPKKIKKIKSIYEINQDMSLDSFIVWQRENNELFQNKINELIDKVNEMEDK